MTFRVGAVALLLAGAEHALASGDVTAEVELGNIEDVESFALDDLLERPVTAASGYAAKPSDSPTIVSTIDHATIRAFGYRTLRDVLGGMRGVYTSNDRNYSYLGSRGLSLPGDYNTRYALSIDSHHVNEPVYGQAVIGPELGLPMIAIDRVELVRGGAWSVHGEQALLGAIQVVTATGASRPGLHINSTSLATLETHDDPAHRSTVAPHGQDVEASYGAVAKGVDIFLAGAYSKDPGLQAIYMPELADAGEPCVDRFGAPTMCNGVVTGGDGDEWGGAFAAIKYKALALRMMASSRVKDVSTAAFGGTIGRDANVTDERAWIDLQYAHSTERTDVIARVAGDWMHYGGRYNYLDGSTPYYSDEYSRGLTLTSEIKGRYKWAALGDHFTDVEVAAGTEARAASALQRAKYVYSDATDITLDRVDPDRIVSLFGHAAGRAFDHVVGFVAMRGDYHADGFGWVFNPQGGLVLDGGALGRIRATISRGYRAATPYEVYYGLIADNPPAELEPERSTTREVSIERYVGENVRLLVVGFYQNVDGLIGLTADTDGAGVFENQDTGTSSYGAEVELEGRWDRLSLRASYSRQRARTYDGMVPANAPDSLMKIAVIAPIAKGRADVAVETNGVAERLSYDRSVIPATFTTNVAVTIHDVVSSLDLSIGLFNVFDDRTGAPSSEEHRQHSIPQEPRTAWLRLSVGLDP